MLGPRAAFPALAALVLATVTAGGCGSSSPDAPEAPPLVVEEGCQALLAGIVADEVSRGGCLLPYPSDFYRTAGRIVLPPAAKPRTATDPGAATDIHEVVPSDGFSLVSTIVASLPSSVAADGLPGLLDDPTASARASSATVILDAETGAFVPHYTDKVDRGRDAAHEPIVLRPFAVLAPRHRYIVALRGVRVAGVDGAPSDAARLAPPPEGFRRLRDRTPDLALDRIRGRFESEVFAPLERAGLARRELQLAWDFTTGSEEEPRADLLRVRELTLAWLAKNPVPTVVTAVTDGTDRIWRVVTATLGGPMFLEHDRPGARLVRGVDGRPIQNGTTTFPLTIMIPTAVRDRFAPGRAIAYGHGFFGGRAELDSNAARTFADQLAAVEFGIDWWGMTREDIGSVASTLGDAPAHGADFVERVHQAMANWLVTTAAIRGALTALPELMRPADGATVLPDGRTNARTLVYDPTFVGYFGASQAHILGGTLVAIDPNISRAVLNVGGGGFTHLMPRSGNFGPFSLVLDVAFRDELVSQGFIAMYQRALDRINPISYAPLVEARPLPGSPARRVLLQIGLGDPGVPNAASFLHARALGLKQTMPAPEAVFGLGPATDPTASALTLFDYGIDTRPSARPAPLPDNEVHEAVRVNPAALKQMDAFLRPDGVVIQPCDGPCDPR